MVSSFNWSFCRVPSWWGEKRKQVISQKHGEQSSVLDSSNVDNVDEFYDNQTAYLQQLVHLCRLNYFSVWQSNLTTW